MHLSCILETDHFVVDSYTVVTRGQTSAYSSKREKSEMHYIYFIYMTNQ
jgi:hypothetical protein